MKIEITVKNDKKEPLELTVKNDKEMSIPYRVVSMDTAAPDDPEFQERLRVGNLVGEFSRKHDMPFELCADVLNKYMQVVFSLIPLDQDCVTLFDDVFITYKGHITKSNLMKLDFLLGRCMEKYERGKKSLSTYVELVDDVTITGFDTLLDVYLRGATAREDSRNYLIGYRLPKIIDYDKLKEETEKVGYYKTKYGIMQFTGEV